MFWQLFLKSFTTSRDINIEQSLNKVVLLSYASVCYPVSDCTGYSQLWDGVEAVEYPLLTGAFMF